MSQVVPYGTMENEKLEFQGRDARPVDVAREVVALLNARGGEIWWGVKERGGQAEKVEPFEDGESRRRDLQNHILDTIEPSPAIPHEVRIELEATGTRGAVIRIQVQKPRKGRPPFAQLKDQGRRYWIRVGDRPRIMSREEIRDRFRQGAGEDLAIQKQILADRERVQKAKKPCLFIKVHPHPELDHRSFDVGDKSLEESLMNPAATGSRRNGWNFVREISKPKIGAQGLKRLDDMDEIEIRRTGAIVFNTRIERLHWKGDQHSIWPHALLEYPVSIMRLAAKVFEKWGADVSDVVVDFVFLDCAAGPYPEDPLGRGQIGIAIIPKRSKMTT